MPDKNATWKEFANATAISVLGWVLACSCYSTNAQTVGVTFTPTVDTSIFSSRTNPQGNATILAGTRLEGIKDRGLLRFNLSSIPQGSMVEAVRLRLTVVRIPQHPPDSNFSLFRMLTDWKEDATWTNATVGTPWAEPGARAGTDYAIDASSTLLIGKLDAYEFGPTAKLTEDVQSWVDDPASNRGWLVKTDNEDALESARHFGSSESAQPPQLIVEYSTSPTGPYFSGVQRDGTNLVLQFIPTLRGNYVLETRSLVEQGTWVTVTNASSGAVLEAITFTVPIVETKAFYRTLLQTSDGGLFMSRIRSPTK